jgi:hypothetical protein
MGTRDQVKFTGKEIILEEKAMGSVLDGSWQYIA